MGTSEIVSAESGKVIAVEVTREVVHGGIVDGHVTQGKTFVEGFIFADIQLGSSELEEVGVCQGC